MTMDYDTKRILICGWGKMRVMELDVTDVHNPKFLQMIHYEKFKCAFGMSFDRKRKRASFSLSGKLYLYDNSHFYPYLL